MTSRPEPISPSDEIRLVPVFVTGKLIEFDMAADLLRQAGIPFETGEETGTGIKLAMPVAPTPGPGTFWRILVPEKALADAQQVLSELPFPITTTPGPWDFLPPETVEERRADVRVQRWIVSIAYLGLSAFIIAKGCVLLATGREQDRGDAIVSIVFGAVFLAIIVGLISYSRRWVEMHPESDGPRPPRGGRKRRPGRSARGSDERRRS